MSIDGDSAQGGEGRPREVGMAPVGSGRTFVLVHGAFHGGWCWRGVAELLRGEGHTVFAPTLTGLGERAHLIGSRPTLSTFVDDVAGVLHMEDLVDVVLVGHSFAGSVISSIADRMPGRLRHLVYLDALVLSSGQAPVDGLPADVVARYEASAEATSGGLSIPPPDPAYFGVLDADQAGWLSRKLTPHPWRSYCDRLELSHPLCNGVPATYVAATAPPFRSTAASRDFVRSSRGWTYREIPTGHDAMLTMPGQLARLLAEVARL